MSVPTKRRYVEVAGNLRAGDKFLGVWRENWETATLSPSEIKAVSRTLKGRVLVKFADRSRVYELGRRVILEDAR
jgi:hypothetical protein